MIEMEQWRHVEQDGDSKTEKIVKISPNECCEKNFPFDQLEKMNYNRIKKFRSIVKGYSPTGRISYPDWDDENWEDTQKKAEAIYRNNIRKIDHVYYKRKNELEL